MCGIVGIVSDHVSVETARVLAQISDVIVHRGPDDSGAHISIDSSSSLRDRALRGRVSQA